ncbi:MAG: restriction endonuclease subunit, partial [Verrucomicrobiales bacterium]|nr:restriction endonuclease subunit [Verrucomicrobiales bacterium]
MNRVAFFKLFETLADTPEAVEKLRKLVLDFAIRGRLVRQNHEEEPATELAERVSALGKRIAKEQKLKLPSPERGIEEGKQSFRLPEGWVWVKLGDLCIKLGAGSTPLGGKQVYQTSGIKFLRSQNIWNEGLHLDDVALITPAVHKAMAATHVQAGDVLLNITGASIGRCAVVPDDFDEANVSQHVAIIRLADKTIRRFIHLIIIASDFQSQIMQVQVGVSREGLSMKNLKEFVVALPPLAEQWRIVAKVEELLALCDELEARQTSAREHRTRLVRSALDHLTTAKDESDFRKRSAFVLQHSDMVLDSVPADFRKSILTLAFQGKLVPQDVNDEIVEKLPNVPVKAERKKAKWAGPIEEQEEPFHLPPSWTWFRLGDISCLKHGYAFSSEFFTIEPAPFVLTTPGNFYEKGGFRDRESKRKYYSGPVDPEFIFKPGDLIIPMTEQAEGLLGSP